MIFWVIRKTNQYKNVNVQQKIVKMIGDPPQSSSHFVSLKTVLEAELVPKTPLSGLNYSTYGDSTSTKDTWKKWETIVTREANFVWGQSYVVRKWTLKRNEIWLPFGVCWLTSMRPTRKRTTSEVFQLPITPEDGDCEKQNCLLLPSVSLWLSESSTYSKCQGWNFISTLKWSLISHYINWDLTSCIRLNWTEQSVFIPLLSIIHRWLFLQTTSTIKR